MTNSMIEIYSAERQPIVISDKLREVLARHGSGKGTESFYVPEHDIVMFLGVATTPEFQNDFLAVLQPSSEGLHRYSRHDANIGINGGHSYLLLKTQAYVDRFDGEVPGFKKSMEELPSFSVLAGNAIHWLKSMLGTSDKGGAERS